VEHLWLLRKQVVISFAQKKIIIKKEGHSHAHVVISKGGWILEGLLINKISIVFSLAFDISFPCDILREML
jgi:hypothetical protein